MDYINIINSNNIIKLFKYITYLFMLISAFLLMYILFTIAYIMFDTNRNNSIRDCVYEVYKTKTIQISDRVIVVWKISCSISGLWPGIDVNSYYSAYIMDSVPTDKFIVTIPIGQLILVSEAYIDINIIDGVVYTETNKIAKREYFEGIIDGVQIKYNETD